LSIKTYEIIAEIQVVELFTYITILHYIRNTALQYSC